MYDKIGLFYKEIVDTLIIVVGAYPGGARNAVNPRFSRHFAVFNVQKATESIIYMIYG